MSLSTIKSYQSGISIHLDPEAAFGEICDDVGRRFEESRKFFKTAKVALSFEGRNLTEEEEKQLVNTITEHSDVEVICLVGKNEITNKNFIKAIKKVEAQAIENNTRLYIGDINEGDIIESEGSLVVYGDVLNGGAAVAKQDIIVFGKIYGHAYAGTSKDFKSIIVCFGMTPEKIKIADLRYFEKAKKGFGRKSKTGPVLLKIEEAKVISLPIDEETLKEFVNR